MIVSLLITLCFYLQDTTDMDPGDNLITSMELLGFYIKQNEPQYAPAAVGIQYWSTTDSP